MPKRIIYTPDKDAHARTVRDQMVAELGKNPSKEKVRQTVRHHAGQLRWLGKRRTRMIQEAVKRRTGLS